MGWGEEGVGCCGWGLVDWVGVDDSRRSILGGNVTWDIHSMIWVGHKCLVAVG